MESLVLYSILTAALYYLGARAMITQRLWSSYSPRLARWADCSACSGAWYGLFLSMSIGWYYDIAVFGFDGRHWLTPIIVMLSMMVLTPMVAGLMQHAINVVGVAVDLEQPPTIDHDEES